MKKDRGPRISVSTRGPEDIFSDLVTSTGPSRVGMCPLYGALGLDTRHRPRRGPRTEAKPELAHELR